MNAFGHDAIRMGYEAAAAAGSVTPEPAIVSEPGMLLCCQIVPLKSLLPGQGLSEDRDSTVVVCVCEPSSSVRERSDTLAAIDRHTPADVALIVIGDAKAAGDLSAVATGDRLVAVIEGHEGDSLSGLLNRAVGGSAAADLLVLRAGCTVPVGWLERMRAAACSDDAIATATPLGTGDTFTISGAVGSDTDRVMASVSRHILPRVLIGGPGCVYIRRRTLELLHGFPPECDSVAAAIGRLCNRSTQTGMVNVVADDVYVCCAPASEADEGKALPAELRRVDRSDDRSPLRRVLSLASAAVGGMSITIDARSLGPSVGGTQSYTHELILALAQSGGLSIRVVVPPDIPPELSGELADAPGVELLDYAKAAAGVRQSHIVHRPQQVFSAPDLDLLQQLGERLVVTHQDLIAYHSPAYHASHDGWKQYRRITRIALAAADRVVFFSEHASRDAQREDLVEADRCDVVGAAVLDHNPPTPRAPAGGPGNNNFLLCLGSDYRHKNRGFAIELVEALRREHGWDGKLVLAGPHVPYGSSRDDERALLASASDLDNVVLELGTVDRSERAWLFGNAKAVIVPSIVEGFGLVPIEAAHHAAPCLYAAQASLVEVIGSELATLVPWDASKSATRVMPLLVDEHQRRAHVERTQAAVRRWSWDRLACELKVTYEQTLRSAYRPSAYRAWQELERERYLVEVDRGREHNRRIAVEIQATHDERLRRLGDLIVLAGDDGQLTEREQRGLRRIGTRPVLSRLMLWPFALVGSLPSRTAGGQGPSSDPPAA
jgi:hypothetical protein